MFNSKRKITRVKIYPVGDYLFDKFIGKDGYFIKEFPNHWGSGEYKITISRNSSDGFDEKDLIDFSNLIIFVKSFQTGLNKKQTKLMTDSYDSYIDMYFNSNQYEKIRQSPDYEKWYNKEVIKSNEFKEKRRLKKSMKKYNV